jgi:hypothetical protein
MLEIQLFVNQLEADLPGWSVTHPTIINKAGLRFEMAIYPYKISCGDNPIWYSELVTACRTLAECTDEVAKHLEAARLFFLSEINKNDERTDAICNSLNA